MAVVRSTHARERWSGEQSRLPGERDELPGAQGAETKNLIIPLVGNFSGDKTLRTVGRYLKERGATVTAFYTSNVEQYLFQQGDDWQRFYANVATLPLDSTSMFIRSLSNGNGFRPGSPNSRSIQLISSMLETLKAVKEDRVQTYYDMIQLAK